MTTDAELPDEGEDEQDMEGPPLHELAEWSVGAALDIANIFSNIEDDEQDLSEVNITATFNAFMLLETLWAFGDLLHEAGVVDIEVLENIVEARKHSAPTSRTIH